MFNRGSIDQRRNANNATPPSYNRGPLGFRSNAMRSSPPPYNRGSSKLRRSATQRPPPPYFGATTGAQKCQPVAAPMGRVTSAMQQCRLAITLPNHSTGGRAETAEMPYRPRPHLTTGSHMASAEMPAPLRSQFIWCRSTRAEMPLYWRTNNQRPLQKRRNVRYASPRTKQGDPLWINVTKTQPLPRYI